MGNEKGRGDGGWVWSWQRGNSNDFMARKKIKWWKKTSWWDKVLQKDDMLGEKIKRPGKVLQKDKTNREEIRRWGVGRCVTEAEWLTDGFAAILHYCSTNPSLLQNWKKGIFLNTIWCHHIMQPTTNSFLADGFAVASLHYSTNPSSFEDGKVMFSCIVYQNDLMSRNITWFFPILLLVPLKPHKSSCLLD